MSGPVNSRRRLLAVIRSEFERIHRGIRNLQPNEMVPIPEDPEIALKYHDLKVMERAVHINVTLVVGDRIVHAKVNDLLNGVDLGRLRKTKKIAGERRGARLFCSYSHSDESLRNELVVQLSLLERLGIVELWHDRKIEAGESWVESIDENLESADVIVFLVSANFVASDYCWNMEMKRALEREAKGEAQVIPIIVRDVKWDKAPFGHLPAQGKAVTTWTNRDSAWRSVSEGIERVVDEILRNRMIGG